MYKQGMVGQNKGGLRSTGAISIILVQEFGISSMAIKEIQSQCSFNLMYRVENRSISATDFKLVYPTL